jgi:broad specificity phosphatase PhoE
MARLHLVRHGRASAGWDADPDPDLDDVGRTQAAAVVDRLPRPGVAVWSSPLLRCQQTAAPYAAAHGRSVQIVAEVAEIPSPEGIAMGHRVQWLRTAMAGTWSDLGDRYTSFRDRLVTTLMGVETDTVVFSHFVAINAVIGACLHDDRLVIRSLDNTSVTVVDVTADGLVLVEGGHEADTLIR